MMLTNTIQRIQTSSRNRKNNSPEDITSDSATSGIHLDPRFPRDHNAHH
jgi:hypothetical protein